MLEISYGNIIQGRATILEYITKRKGNDFSVVDVGGAVNGWSASVVDTLIDINAPRPTDFKINISDHASWQPIFEYVDQHGLFDYAICTHTLEDIANPRLVLDCLPKIAKQGVITVPSAVTELSRIESPNWLGYIHHRHIVGLNEHGLVLAPKLSFLEQIMGDGLLHNPKIEELVVYWKDTIEYSLFMDDYLGPDVSTVINEYQNFIRTTLTR